MSWFIIALVPPLLWAICNHIDKYLLSKYLKSLGFGSLILFSALIGPALLPIILIIQPRVFAISPILALVIMASGSLYIISLIPYMKALAQEEASRIIPFFQTMPIFGYLLGYFFLQETLTWLQIFSSVLIIAAAVILNIEIKTNRAKINFKAIWLMVLSSFLLALITFLFKFVALQGNFWQTTFWEYIGFSLTAIFILVFVKSYRRDFFQVWKHNTAPVLLLNAGNEILNIIAKIILTFATLSAPLALVFVASGTTPFFVFLIGIILTIFLPKWGKENISKKVLVQKIIAIIILFIGSYLLNK